LEDKALGLRQASSIQALCANQGNFMTTTFSLLQELLSLMNAREKRTWCSDVQEQVHRDSWASVTARARAHTGSEFERQVLDKVLNAMDMQDKRESGELHITAEAAQPIWHEAKLAGEALLIRTASSQYGHSVPLSPNVKVIASAAVKPADASSCLKQRADAIGRVLANYGFSPKHGELLTAIARAEGHKSFPSLQATLRSKRPNFCPHCGAAGTLALESTAPAGEAHYRCTRCPGKFAVSNVSCD
jgi:hypothetical protein